MADEYLELFDSLDLDKSEHARVAIYILEDFFGNTMTNVSREVLDLDLAIHRRNLAAQWGELGVYLDQEDYSAKFQEYQGLINKLKRIRDKVAHNDSHEVDSNQIKDIRDSAEGWRDWLEESASNVVKEDIPVGRIIENQISMNLSRLSEGLKRLDKTEEREQDVALRDLKALSRVYSCRFEALKDEEIDGTEFQMIMLLRDTYEALLDLQKDEKYESLN